MGGGMEGWGMVGGQKHSSTGFEAQATSSLCGKVNTIMATAGEGISLEEDCISNACSGAAPLQLQGRRLQAHTHTHTHIKIGIIPQGPNAEMTDHANLDTQTF